MKWVLKSTYFVFFVMWSHHKNEEEQRNENGGRGYEIGGSKGKMLCQQAAREDADAQTKVPRSEIRGSGRATLGIGGQVDEQRVERGEGRAETQATAEGDQ